MRRAFKAKTRTSLRSIPAKKDKSYQMSLSRSKDQFNLDSQIFKEINTCSFIRPFALGEADGFILPEEINISEIKWTYVLDPGSLDHVREHMKILPTHKGAVMFDIVEGERVHARILLKQEQMEIVRKSVNKVEVGKIVDGKVVIDS